MTIDVELLWYERALAWDVAGRRVASSKRDKLADRGSAAFVDEKERLWRTFNGTAGEVAAAKGLGLFWSGSVDTFHAPDIGRDIQVRTRTGAFDELCVRPDDNDDHRYVLVIGNVPTFRLIGWLYGYEAKDAEWRGWSGKAAVWYVPTGKLHRMDTFT